jgi:hypothetical protein
MYWRRPSARTISILVLAAGLVVSSRGANAVALSGLPVHDASPAAENSPAAAENAVLQAEAGRLTAQYESNRQALRQSGRQPGAPAIG